MAIQKIVVGISGGVDSSVAAFLLKEQGYEVEGLFMKNWDERGSNGNCMWESDVADAMHVCEKLGINLNTVDLSSEYWHGVFSQFLEEYKNGRTPNPDVLCNQEIKFSAFLNHALELGADSIATGHYARIANNNTRLLLKGCDKNKDQSYFLCRVGQTQLARSLFPVGELEKPRVRLLAKKAGLITHDKKDSTGICFIGEQSFRDFLSRYIPRQPGDIQTTDGKTVGTHDGVWYYTLGQRQGLGIGGIKGTSEEPWYVVGKEISKNILYITQGHDHPLLFSQSLRTKNAHWVAGHAPKMPLSCKAKIRYRQADQSCVIENIEGSEYQVKFTQPQRAVTPGQFVVFYDNDICLGGGVIHSTGQLSCSYLN
jgi:tRNA-uridine 2-sulfurtransferase